MGRYRTTLTSLDDAASEVNKTQIVIRGEAGLNHGITHDTAGEWATPQARLGAGNGCGHGSGNGADLPPEKLTPVKGCLEVR